MDEIFVFVKQASKKNIVVKLSVGEGMQKRC